MHRVTYADGDYVSPTSEVQPALTSEQPVMCVSKTWSKSTYKTPKPPIVAVIIEVYPCLRNGDAEEPTTIVMLQWCTEDSNSTVHRRHQDA